MSFYVYLHRTQDGRIFYVGKGTGDRFAVGGTERNQIWNRIVTKHGFVSEIVATMDEERLAFEEEVRLIAKHNTYIGEGANPDAWGANLTRGGEGWSGRRHSQTTKQRLREASMGNQRAAKPRSRQQRCSTCNELGHNRLRCPPGQPGLWPVTNPAFKTVTRELLE